VAVARELDRLDVPGPVRPYLKMQWLPAAALAPIRRVLDSDASFRSRVASVAAEDVLGRASWLYLVRPDGWDAELTSLAAATSSVDAASADEREERSARRKLASLTNRLAAAEARIEELSASQSASVRDLAAERAARDAAEASAASLSARVDALRHERDDARARLARADARIADLQRSFDADVREPGADVRGTAGDTVVAASAAIHEALAAAEQLRVALTAAAGALSPGAGDDDAPAAPAPATPPVRSRRVPLRLPGGLFDDSIEAADWLVRRPGVAVLVDGYNCTLRDGPFAGLPIPEQRRRLVDALTELASRTQAEIEVVFDGADVEQPLSSGRRGVRVTFSALGVEADDVVVDRAGTLPAGRPVVVVSSDKRVRAGAAERGANVISAEQLMALLRART
jgi:predicted RNA-binding protein with PIN domain